MPSIHLSPAEARALGVDAPSRSRTTRQAATGKWTSRCTTCGAILEGETAAARHNQQTRHARYETVR